MKPYSAILRLLFRIAFPFVLLLNSGCTLLLVDQAKQYDKSQKFAVPTSQQARLNVPFVEQKENYCGPAALAMVAAYHGNRVQQQDIADLTFLPGKQGSLQVSMVSATRQLGMVPYVLSPSINQLILEVQSGHPVIILQNKGVRFYPRWHYAVVVGYDTDAKTFLLHSGPDAYLKISMDKLQRTHDLAERWTLIPLPNGQLPTTASAADVLQAASDLEALRQLPAAQATYQAGVQKWPQDFALQLGLANTLMQLKQPFNASRAYRNALQINRHSAEALNNYAYCAHALGCERTAIDAARCAISLNKADNPAIRSTLSELLANKEHPVNAPDCPIIHCETAADSKKIVASQDSVPAN